MLVLVCCKMIRPPSEYFVMFTTVFLMFLHMLGCTDSTFAWSLHRLGCPIKEARASLNLWHPLARFAAVAMTLDLI